MTFSANLPKQRVRETNRVIRGDLRWARGREQADSQRNGRTASSLPRLVSVSLSALHKSVINAQPSHRKASGDTCVKPHPAGTEKSRAPGPLSRPKLNWVAAAEAGKWNDIRGVRATSRQKEDPIPLGTPGPGPSSVASVQRLTRPRGRKGEKLYTGQRPGNKKTDRLQRGLFAPAG